MNPILYNIRFSYINKTGEQAVDYFRALVSDSDKLSQAIRHYQEELVNHKAADISSIKVGVTVEEYNHGEVKH